MLVILVLLFTLADGVLTLLLLDLFGSKDRLGDWYR